MEWTDRGYARPGAAPGDRRLRDRLPGGAEGRFGRLEVRRRAVVPAQRTFERSAERPTAVPRRDRLFWPVALGLVLYVALCTGQRGNLLQADAWEHHRAVAALVRDLAHPGNPTFALDTPSIRYSPYTVGLALFCRA